MLRSLPLLAALLVVFAPAARATVSLDVAVERLNDGSGAASPTGTLVLLVADTNRNGLGPARSGELAVSAALDGTFGDDLIVFATDLSILGAAGVLGASTGALDFESDETGRWDAGDPLHLVWFPSLSLANPLLPAGAAYGVLSAGTTPADGAIEALTYLSPTKSGLFGNVSIPANSTDTVADRTSVNGLVPPAVATSAADSVTETSAVLGGEVSSEGDLPVTTRGVVWSTSPNPSLSNGSILPASGGGLGVYIVGVGGLDPGTTYHARAYATTSSGSSYGEDRFFTTSAALVLVNGIASANRTILPGDVHRFHFTLSGPRSILLNTSGGAILRARILDGSGQVVAEQTTAGAINFANQALDAGNYTLELESDSGAGSPQSYTLALDATVSDFAHIDAAVGTGLPATVGLNVFLPVVQQVILSSPNGRTVTGYVSMSNRGGVRDRVDILGTQGNTEFSVTYFDDIGNVTAAVTTGTYATPEMDPGTAPRWVRATITPTKRAVLLRRSYTLNIQGRSRYNASVRDDASIKVETRN